MTTLTPITITENKPCAWCAKPIEAGSQAVERRTRYPGDKPKVHVVHERCNRQMEAN